MKISVIGPVFPYRGGIAHFTTLLVKNLIQEGHSVQTISFKKQYPKWLYPGKSDKDFSESRERVEADLIITPFNPFSWAKAVKRINEFQPEDVILPWWVTFWGPCFRFIARALNREGIRVTFLIHNTLPHEVGPVDRFATKNTLKFANRFIVMTEKEKQHLLALLPDANNIKIAPHPIYNRFKPTGMDKATIRSKLGLPDGKKFVLFFGFVRPYKGLSDLLDAIKLCNQEDPQIHLIVAGEFWGDREQYLQKIQALGIQGVVHFFDRYIPDDEAAQFFEVADVFAAPYRGGTQSGAVKTALGFGLPIVLTDVIADEMLMTKPEACKIIPAESKDALGKAIIEMIEQPRISETKTRSLFHSSWKNLISVILGLDQETEEQITGLLLNE